MSAALFDLALRVAARDRGGPVPRLLHNPAPARDVAVAVGARRTGPVVHVQAISSDGQLESGSGPDGLAAIARAAGCRGGDLGSGPTALVDSLATLRALAGLATSYADPARCANTATSAGAALAGWWVERAAHPGTTAVTDVLAATRARFMLGVAPGTDHPQQWRRALGVPAGLAGLHTWHRAITAGPVLPGLESLREDDDWHLARHQGRLRHQEEFAHRSSNLQPSNSGPLTRMSPAACEARGSLREPPPTHRSVV